MLPTHGVIIPNHLQGCNSTLMFASKFWNCYKHLISYIAFTLCLLRQTHILHVLPRNGLMRVPRRPQDAVPGAPNGIMKPPFGATRSLKVSRRGLQNPSLWRSESNRPTSGNQRGVMMSHGSFLRTKCKVIRHRLGHFDVPLHRSRPMFFDVFWSGSNLFKKPLLKSKVGMFQKYRKT